MCSGQSDPSVYAVPPLSVTSERPALNHIYILTVIFVCKINVLANAPHSDFGNTLLQCHKCLLSLNHPFIQVTEHLSPVLPVSAWVLRGTLWPLVGSPVCLSVCVLRRLGTCRGGYPAAQVGAAACLSRSWHYGILFCTNEQICVALTCASEKQTW